MQNGTKDDKEAVRKAYHDQEMPKQNAIPETLPKAVPGTRLPGKKNWVIGKFGRVLPVVYLRRRDRKKIAKFDPSKTTHCLKKIKPVELDITVSELTWNLESKKENGSGTPGESLQMKGKKHKKSKLKVLDSAKTDFDLSNGLEKHEKCDKKASADTLEGDFVPLPSASHPKELSAEGNSDLDSDSSTSQSGSDTGHYHLSAVFTCKRNTLSNTVGNSWNKIDGSTSSVSRSRDGLQVSTSSKKNSVSAEKKKVKVDVECKKKVNETGVEGVFCNKIYNEDNSLNSSLLSRNISTVQLEDDENLSDQNNSIASDRNSSDTSNESSDIESSGKEIVIKKSRYHLSSENDTTFGEISHEIGGSSSKGLQIRSPKTKDKSKIVENPQKQKNSNEKRLDALEDKKKSILAQRNLIKDALIHLDSGTQSHDGKKHIVFSDNDDDVSGDDVKEKAAYSIGDKVSMQITQYI